MISIWERTPQLGHITNRHLGRPNPPKEISMRLIRERNRFRLDSMRVEWLICFDENIILERKGARV